MEPVQPLKPKHLPFNVEGLNVADVIARADAMAERYQVRINEQIRTINRFIEFAGESDVVQREVARLHKELAEARTSKEEWS